MKKYLNIVFECQMGNHYYEKPLIQPKGTEKLYEVSSWNSQRKNNFEKLKIDYNNLPSINTTQVNKTSTENAENKNSFRVETEIQKVEAELKKELMILCNMISQAN
ncbi:UNKNOWN [Stylonychia lemnae]|uniref:Uncharacterized protein n=1 Tax=Stylonychia lemnae TaxID=5949 RepID=A0A078AXI2_STYLE|nr:UNKNOWN [Stylonychia lemnae]|eukprot:CDW86781.1 UNKNOWN [Stylonychia lemnae]